MTVTTWTETAKSVCMGYIYRGKFITMKMFQNFFLIEMKEGMVDRGEGIPQRHNTNEVLMMCVDEQ